MLMMVSASGLRASEGLPRPLKHEASLEMV